MLLENIKTDITGIFKATVEGKLIVVEFLEFASYNSDHEYLIYALL